MSNLLLVGQFNRNVGLKYQSLLQEEGIDVFVEDWSNSLEVTAGYSMIRLLVPVQDYQRSLKFIDDFEDSASKRLTESGDKSVGKVLLKIILEIFIKVLIMLGIFVALFYILKSYNIHSAKEYYKQGIVEYKKGNFVQSIKDYTKVINIFPKYANAYFNRGLAYYKCDNFSFAIADFTQAMELDPNYVRAYYIRGRAYEKLGSDSKAIADYTNAITINPEYAHAYIARGCIYDKQKNHSQAIEDFSKAVEINPKENGPGLCEGTS